MGKPLLSSILTTTTTTTTTTQWLLLLILFLFSTHYHHCNPTFVVHGHGYLTSPRSRNLLAYQETVWWPQTENDPEPETCPHCLNRGGSLGRCGVYSGGGVERNYDTPKNVLGGPMPTNIQAEYVQGQNIVLDVTLTAHHKGHFVFSACPISPPHNEIPTQECFDQHKLTFVSDLLHNANYDPKYPERAYLAPVSDQENYVLDLGSTKSVIDYSFNMLLPKDLYGDVVLIQWYYLTANSCYHEGYQEYNWPPEWQLNDATSSGKCGTISPDGNGVPEQFWNCAEVRILQGANNNQVNNVPPPPTPSAITTTTTTTMATNGNPSNKPTSIMEMSSGIAIPVSLPTLSQSTNNNNNMSPSSAGTHGKTIVGYYASWQWYDRQGRAAPKNMDFTKVQRVNFAFFQIDEQGNMWGTDSWADPNLLFGPINWNPPAGSRQYCSWDTPTNKVCNYHNYEQGLIHMVHAAGAEIYPSLGGWTLSDAFPAMSADANARAKFTRNCIKLIREYDFDGIDIDWEYPGYEDHSGTPQDKGNFRLLLDDVRAALDGLGVETGRFYGLTAALPCGPRHIANMDIAHVAGTLSELNLMTYDFHGAFSKTSGINAPMYYQGWGEEDFDVHSCVENWLAGGGSRDKINIGLPFYGRSVGAATGLNQAHNGADMSSWAIDEGTPQYFNIVAKLPFMTTVWDKKTWTPYAYFDNGGMVSFDDENSICVKVQYAIENGLGGFIIWELSGDLMDDLSTPLLDVTNTKLHNPDYNCGEPGFYPEEVQISVPSSAPTKPTNLVVGPDVTPPSTPANPSGFPGPGSPGTFPTQPFPTSNTVTSPVSLKPSEPAAELPSSQTVDDQPVNSPLANQPINDQPNDRPFPTQPFPTSNTVTSPVSLNPSEPAAELSYSQAVDDQPVNGPLPTQPLNDQPNNQPMNDQPKLFLCGDQQSKFNIAESTALDLSFQYEIHRIPGVPLSDAIKELKSAVLNGIAEKLNCAKTSSVARSLRSNWIEASQQYIMAIESTHADLPEDDGLCSVPLNLDEPTICQSVIGFMTAYFEKGTSESVLSEVSEELLFYIRTSMASGIYESADIQKVIYIELLSSNYVGFNEASPNTQVDTGPQSEGGTNSSIAAIVWSLLVIALGAFTVFVFGRSKRRLEPCGIEEHVIIMENEPDIHVPAAMPESYSAEESWKRALKNEEIWRNAMKTFSDEERAMYPESSTGTSPAESTVDQMIQFVEKSDEGGDQLLAGREKYEVQSEPWKGYDDMHSKPNHSEDFDYHGERSDNSVAMKKKRKLKKNHVSVDRNENLPSESEEETLSSDSNVQYGKIHYVDEDGKIHFDDNDRQQNVDDGGGKELEHIANDKTNGQYYQELNQMDYQSSFGSGSDGNLDLASDGKKDDKEERIIPYSAQDNEMTSSKAIDAFGSGSNGNLNLASDGKNDDKEKHITPYSD